MTQTGSNISSPEKCTPQKPEQNPCDPLNTLFNSLFALPRSIYNRGNDHGRAFTQRYPDENDDGEAPRPRSARRECARWEGQDYRGQDSREEQVPAKDSLNSQTVNKPEELAKTMESRLETEMDDWVQKIISELEKGEKEARQLYEQWMAVSDVKPTHPEPERETTQTRDKDVDLTRPPQAPERSPWVEMFPSWSATGHNQGQEHDNRRYMFSKDAEQHRRQQKSIEELDMAIYKPHKDLGCWLNSRLGQDEGLFGASMLFSRPLFSIGMRPFLPEQSALGYLLFSEYSPLHLEHEEGFDSSFRQRFEDLLRAEDGKAMTSKEERAPGNTTSIAVWLGKLVPLLKEGDNSGPDQITTGSDTWGLSIPQVRERKTPLDSLRLTQDPYDGPATEQDIYQQHFSNIPCEPFQISSAARSLPQESENLSSRPSILSTMTRTERHVAPDGSVTTKTILKKSFVDGSEENSETTETTPATRPAWREQQSKVERGPSSEIAKAKSTPDQEPRRGWFWSS